MTNTYYHLKEVTIELNHRGQEYIKNIMREHMPLSVNKVNYEGDMPVTIGTHKLVTFDIPSDIQIQVNGASTDLNKVLGKLRKNSTILVSTDMYDLGENELAGKENSFYCYMHYDIGLNAEEPIYYEGLGYVTDTDHYYPDDLFEVIWTGNGLEDKLGDPVIKAAHTYTRSTPNFDSDGVPTI